MIKAYDIAKSAEEIAGRQHDADVQQAIKNAADHVETVERSNQLLQAAQQMAILRPMP